MRLLALATVSLLMHAPAQQITWIYNPANGHSYGAYPTTTSWSAGEALAVSLGGHLATIRSVAEQAWIEANFGSYLGTHGLWIGFNDIATEGQWVWSSGEPVTYTNWGPGQPDNGGNSNEDAAHVYGPIGGVDLWKWNDETESFANILRPLIELPAASWTQSPVNGHLYAVTPQMDWTAAEALAQQQGGHLATVRTAAENAWLVSTFANGTERLWIGLNDAQAEGTFVWTSGEPVVFTNWYPGEPNNAPPTGEDYVHLVAIPSHAPLGGVDQWNDLPDVATFAGALNRGVIEVALPAASFTSFGVGCPSPGGPAPLLTGVPGEEPRLGTTSRIRVSNLPLVVTVPVFVLGESNTQDPGPPAYSLPLDLGFLGWTGCSQLVSDEVTSFAITISGQADYTLAVPVNLTLVGFTFHAQALVLYHPSGVAVSNGVTGVVGY